MPIPKEETQDQPTQTSDEVRSEAPARVEPVTIMPPAIAKALVAVQAEVKTVIKGAKNEHFGNTYAELADVQGVALPLLSKHGLLLSQWPITRSGKHYLRSYLVHESGVGMVDDIDLLLTKNDPQGLGSAITYQRRQTTMAILGLSAEDDDDGNKAANRQAKPTVDQISEIRQLCIDLKYSPDQAETRIVSLRTEDQATVAIANLRKNVSQRAAQIRDEGKAIPVFTGDQDQVVPKEVISAAKTVKTSEDIVMQIQRQMLELPINDKGRRSLVAHVTGLKFANAKPFLKNCNEDEITAIAEAVEEIKAGTYNVPADWVDDIAPPVETA